MSRLMYIFILAILVSACGSSERQHSDKNKQDDVINHNNENSDDNSENVSEEATTITDISKEMIMEFVPEDYELVEWSKGNLNLDDREDALLVVQKGKSKKSNNSTGSTESTSSDDDNSEEKRPLIILTMDNKGKLQQVGQNDAVILCPACGGVMGDPFSGFTIKNGYFSAEHHGGSNWRWNRIITFKYNKNSKEWYLHKDGLVSWHSSDPDKVKETILSKKDFGTISFEDYNVDNMDL